MSLTVIIPAYNEEETLIQVVHEALESIRQLGIEFEIIIVDDGSVDRTAELAREIASECEEIRLLSHEQNLGSGMSIRTGINNARHDLITYIPADGQFDALEIGKFIEATQESDIVIGARMDRSDYSAFRLLSSYVFITLANFLFRFNFKDVNWVHMWKKQVFEQMTLRSTGVFLLEEILVRTAAAGLTISEIDSRYKPRIGGIAKGSHPLTIIKTIFEMVNLWCELRFGRKGK